MQTYRGGCHCGAVRFEFDTELNWVSRCNCSICTKKGSVTHRIPPEQFRLVSGEEALTLYPFNTRTARHLFSKHCGIHGFHQTRSHPGWYSINLRCVDGFDLENPALEQRFFDGQNFEASMAQLEQQ